MDPAMREPIEGQLDKLSGAMEPWAADGGYFNYAERPDDVEDDPAAGHLRAARPGEAQLGPGRPHSGEPLAGDGHGVGPSGTAGRWRRGERAPTI